MELKINGQRYQVIVEKKDIKNLYLRVKEDKKIYVSTNKKVSDFYIKNFLKANKEYIKKQLDALILKESKNKDKIMFLGNYYNISYIDKKDLILGSNKIFINKNFDLDKWYKKQAKKLFFERYEICKKNFDEKVAFPELKIRRMKTKWGVCNKASNTITLNQELIKKEIKYLDYVIHHELSHLKHMDHSYRVWALVEKYIPDYKKMRKEMKDVL